MPRQRVRPILADDAFEMFGLGRAAGIGPDERGANGPVLGIQQHRAHHLAAHHQAGHLCRVGAGPREQTPGGFHDRPPPVIGVLLRDAVVGEAGAVVHGDGGHKPSIVAVQRCLVPGGAEVVRDDHGRAPVK